MRPLLALAPILLGVLLPPAAAASAAEPSPYAELAALEGRVAVIGFRLTTANAAWCPAVQPQFGWIWGDPRLYSEAQRAEALAAYHAADIDAPYIAAVAPGAAAGRAGLHVGAPVLAVDGHAVPANESADPFARIAAIETLRAALPPRGMVEISGAAKAKTAVTPVPGCASDFRVDARDRPEGAADGRLVVVSGGLVRFAASDDELAAAVALASSASTPRGAIAGSASSSAAAPDCSNRPRSRPTGCRPGCSRAPATTRTPRSASGPASASARGARCSRPAPIRAGATGSQQSKPKCARSTRRARRGGRSSRR